MSKTYPTRASLKAQAAQVSLREPATVSKAEPAPASRSEAALARRSKVRWTAGLALAVIVVVVAVLFGGFVVWRSELPPVQAVEGPLDNVSVTGRPGSQPVLSLSAPVDVQSTKLRVQTRGEGRQIVQDSPVLVSLTAFDGQTGRNLNPDGAANLILGTANETDLGPLLSTLLIGANEGARLVVARPLDDGTSEIDVIDVLYTIAKGEVNAGSAGPLAVSFSDDGPIVTHEEGDPPSDLVVQVLNFGSGAQVKTDDVVVVQYLAGTWAGQRLVGSTWASGAPVMVDLSSSMPGVRDALVDQKVGSRLAVTIPAEMATGEDNLYVVVDILGAMPAANTDAPTETIGDDQAD